MNSQQQMRHLPENIWACPACQEGWQQYVIATDQNVCSKCGYTGGDPEKWRKLVEAVRGRLPDCMVCGEPVFADKPHEKCLYRTYDESA